MAPEKISVGNTATIIIVHTILINNSIDGLTIVCSFCHVSVWPDAGVVDGRGKDLKKISFSRSLLKKS